MEKKTKEVKVKMFEHSKAKVELYSNYLSVYLNILSRVPFIKKILLYDLMCGEGIYLDGSKGSPLMALEKIKHHYFKNNKTSPNMTVWFNDNALSDIEDGKYKIDRVKGLGSKIFKPNNVEVFYSKENYSKILPKVLSQLKSLNDERALLFIDPYGYKDVKPDDIKEILKCHKSEVILFLPVSHMYRFASKSLEDVDFPGGVPLKSFLETLFLDKPDLSDINSVHAFIEILKKSFKQFLSDYKIFVDSFSLERDKQNVYCLFFFTPNILGFEKMLEEKWRLDEINGRGFKLDTKQSTLFTTLEYSSYPELLKSFICENPFRTNSEIYLFGLEHGYLPKHSNTVLKSLQKTNKNFTVDEENGKKSRKGAFYISSKNYGSKPMKIVRISLIIK